MTAVTVMSCNAFRMRCSLRPVASFCSSIYWNKWVPFAHGPAGSVLQPAPPFATGKGFSQDDLAYEAGVSRSYLSQLEKGAFYAPA